MGNPVPVAPSLEPVLDAVLTPREDEAPNRRTLRISALAIIAAFLAALAAQLLTRLIGLITNVAFYGRWSMSFVSPSDNSLGMAVVIVPIIGAVLVGVMARYGSAAIRGHGIPEAMEQVLLNESRISPKVMFLKPLSAAISIGTGGPFGAEGPIIATGGALGSVIGQLFHITADERKTLLAAGAAAGMAATFGTPVAAVLLAVELLLFEYRPRSLIPVSLAAATATGVRIAFVGAAPVFPMPNIAPPSGEALATYIALGAAIGVVAVFVTRGLYGVEDLFEQLPIHWMWWPAIGAVVVGVVGYFAPRTLGVGYENIEQMVAGSIAALNGFLNLALASGGPGTGNGVVGGAAALVLGAIAMSLGGLALSRREAGRGV